MYSRERNENLAMNKLPHRNCSCPTLFPSVRILPCNIQKQHCCNGAALVPQVGCDCCILSKVANIDSCSRSCCIPVSRLSPGGLQVDCYARRMGHSTIQPMSYTRECAFTSCVLSKLHVQGSQRKRPSAGHLGQRTSAYISGLPSQQIAPRLHPRPRRTPRYGSVPHTWPPPP